LDPVPKETDSILRMLDVRASEALPAWLAARLGERHPGARARVLRIHPGRAARVKGKGPFEAFAVAAGGADDQPVPLAGDAALEAVLHSGEPAMTRESASARVLVPFLAHGEVRQVVDLHLASAGDIADPLIAVGRKYYERLVEGETDPLTKLANRRLFQAHIDAGVKRWTASGRSYYFAMLDLDHFKRVNDDFGHLYGDEILVHFANLMRTTFRSADQLYRFGGEEFVVIFGVEPQERGGDGTLERFRKAVEAYRFPGVGEVTVSIGFTRVADASTAAPILIDRADEALYYAKEHGRNRVCGWEALVEAGEVKPKAAPKADVTLF
jgi:diguanylate cyclase (GGDEF)-like protein